MVATFDPRTGNFVPQPDAQELVDMISHEIAMRELGADPVIYPSASLDELRERRKFWSQLAGADVEEARRAWNEETDFMYWESDEMN